MFVPGATVTLPLATLPKAVPVSPATCSVARGASSSTNSTCAEATSAVSINCRLLPEPGRGKARLTQPLPAGSAGCRRRRMFWSVLVGCCGSSSAIVRLELWPLPVSVSVTGIAWPLNWPGPL